MHMTSRPIRIDSGCKQLQRCDSILCRCRR